MMTPTHSTRILGIDPGLRSTGFGVIDTLGNKLGYVPRKENRAVAAALDRGEPLRARISRLREEKDPWKRLEFEVLLEL